MYIELTVMVDLGCRLGCRHFHCVEINLVDVTPHDVKLRPSGGTTQWLYHVIDQAADNKVIPPAVEILENTGNLREIGQTTCNRERGGGLGPSNTSGSRLQRQRDGGGGGEAAAVSKPAMQVNRATNRKPEVGKPHLT